MLISRDHIYQGRIIDLSVDHVELPNGKRCDLEIVHHPGGAAAVALDEQGRICLLRQYRHAAGGYLWELPAGKLEPGEPPLETARRELAEEAGVSAEQWRPLGSHVSSPGVFTEVIHLFLATTLGAVPAQTEEHEVLEVHWFDYGEALGMAREGEIRDGKTLIGVFLAQAAAAG